MYNDYNYNRGGMGGMGSFEPEEKHHKGAAILLAIFSIVWIGFYSYWMNYVVVDCCYTYTNNENVFGACYNFGSNTSPVDVSAEFRMICVVGVSLYVVLLLVSMGHLMKPFRVFSKIFGVAIFVALFGFFIASNVFRFRDAGRTCSLDNY